MTNFIPTRFKLTYISQKGLGNITLMSFHLYVPDWVDDLSFWRGLNDKASEGDFRWEHDGMTPIFTAWGPSEPNGVTAF